MLVAKLSNASFDSLSLWSCIAFSCKTEHCVYCLPKLSLTMTTDGIALTEIRNYVTSAMLHEQYRVSTKVLLRWTLIVDSTVLGYQCLRADNVPSAMLKPSRLLALTEVSKVQDCQTGTERNDTENVGMHLYIKTESVRNDRGTEKDTPECSRMFRKAWDRINTWTEEEYMIHIIRNGLNTVKSYLNSDID